LAKIVIDCIGFVDLLRFSPICCDFSSLTKIDTGKRGWKWKGQKKMFELQVNSITTLRVKFAFIDVQLYSSMIAIFLQTQFLIELNGPRFGLGLYLFLILCTSAISRCWIFLGRGFFIFDEGTLFLSHRYKFGTCGNRISNRFCFASIPSPEEGLQRTWKNCPFHITFWCWTVSLLYTVTSLHRHDRDLV